MEPEIVEYIYSVYCKNGNQFNLLKKVFKNKYDACKYALNKINNILEDISDEYLSNKSVLPLPAQLIYTLFKMKGPNNIDQYNYIYENYKKFFKEIDRESIMFIVSTHTLI